MAPPASVARFRENTIAQLPEGESWLEVQPKDIDITHLYSQLRLEQNQDDPSYCDVTRMTAAKTNIKDPMNFVLFTNSDYSGVVKVLQSIMKCDYSTSHGQIGKLKERYDEAVKAAALFVDIYQKNRAGKNCGLTLDLKRMLCFSGTDLKAMDQRFAAIDEKTHLSEEDRRREKGEDFLITLRTSVVYMEDKTPALSHQ